MEEVTAEKAGWGRNSWERVLGEYNGRRSLGHPTNPHSNLALGNPRYNEEG